MCHCHWHIKKIILRLWTPPPIEGCNPKVELKCFGFAYLKTLWELGGNTLGTSKSQKSTVIQTFDKLDLIKSYRCEGDNSVLQIPKHLLINQLGMENETTTVP
jgi:hypothetical protein